MSEHREWKDHPLTQRLLKRVADELELAEKDLRALSRTGKSLQDIGADTIGLNSAIDTFELIKSLIEEEDADLPNRE